MTNPILEMRGVSKSFFGIKALHKVDLTVTVAENIYLGREISHSGLLARGNMRDGVGPILERLGADFSSSIFAILPAEPRRL
jgi:ABC-type sugar transport system ATPase subunit